MSDGNEFAELLWENGQAVVHGRRTKHQQMAAPFPPFGYGGGGTSSGGGRAQEKHPGDSAPVAAAFAKTGGVFGAMGMAPSVHDFGPGLDAAAHDNGDDDTVPWIHYPIIDDDDGAAAPALAAEDYCSDFFSELQAAAANLASLPPSNHNATGSIRSSTVASRESHGLSSRASQPQASELAAPRQPRPSGGSGSEGVMNFSLFSRPAAMARASLQSAQRPQGTDKASNATASNRVESTVVQTASGSRNAPRATWPPPAKEVRFAATAAPTPATVQNRQQEMDRDKAGGDVVAKKDEARSRKAPEAMLATSSVCSGNGAGSDEAWRQQKRKIQAECSASQDEDLDDEPILLRRSATRSTKRSRTAEVHNLSERRRRDRINEKMRALQELIPNCNKIDKASMLDEAIEYLKTLQLQVQMMSMGTGLCIPPMLLPPAMQHLQMPPMAHFPHLGMGLGYGMGVFDMNGTGTIPIPPMPGAHFPCPMIPGAAPQGLGIPGTNTLAMFGVPGQAIPSSTSSLPPFASLAGLPVRPSLAPQVSGATANMMQEQQQGIANQLQQSLNKEAAQGANTCDPQIQIVMQGESQHFRVPSSAQSKSCHLFDGSNKENSNTKNGPET